MANSYLEDTLLTNDLVQSSTRGKSLFDRIGGRPTLERVHKIFYDRLFADSWLQGFFAGVDQRRIENQQTDFFSMLTGGPKVYEGRMPQHAHAHIFINEELFIARHEILRQSLLEAHIAPTEMEEWLKIDLAFKRVLEKASPADCKKRYVDEEIVVIPNPSGRKAS